MLTERQIFFSTNPRALLLNYTPDQLQAAFNISDIAVLIDRTYTKYNRIDIIKWDPEPESAFYEYNNKRVVSVDHVMENIEHYSPMALQKLLAELNVNIVRWGNNNEFIDLQTAIVQRLNRIINVEAILDEE